MKDGVISSLENRFSRGTGRDQGIYDYLSQDEASVVSPSRYQVQQT